VTIGYTVLYAGIIAGAGNTLEVTGNSGAEFKTYSASHSFGKLVIDTVLYTAGSGGTGGSDTSFGRCPGTHRRRHHAAERGQMRENNSGGITLSANRGITNGPAAG